MSKRDMGPAWIALSIALAVAAVVCLYAMDAVFFDAPKVQIDDDLSPDGYREAFYKYKAEYQIWTLVEGRKHFEWNLRSTKYIFWVSMMISLSGVVFAFWQFAQANKYDRAQGEHDELAFKSHMASLSFKSRSVAALILFVSIVYLLIYVAFLYPIRNVPGPVDQEAEARRAAEAQAVVRREKGPGEVFDDEDGVPLPQIGPPVPDLGPIEPERN